MEALFNPRDLSTNELAAEAICSFGDLRLRVTGSSMLPALRPDDVLLVRRCAIDESQPGDVVLYIRQRRLFAHRVISRSATHLITQGDGLAEPDPPVMAEELLGKVVRVMRSGRAARHPSKPIWSSRLAAGLFRRSATAGRIFTRLQSLRSRAFP